MFHTLPHVALCRHNQQTCGMDAPAHREGGGVEPSALGPRAQLLHTPLQPGDDVYLLPFREDSSGSEFAFLLLPVRVLRQHAGSERQVQGLQIPVWKPLSPVSDGHCPASVRAWPHVGLAFR